MKFVKIGLTVVVAAVAAFFIWNYLAGPLKMRRDMQAFADSLAQCETISQTVKVPRTDATIERSVDGLRDGRCYMRMETLGPHVMHCAFPEQDLPAMAQGFADMVDQIGIFGGFHYTYSSSNPDPLTEAMNSDACTTTVE